MLVLNDALFTVKDLPYLKMGPFHTNTVAGLQLAMDLLRENEILTSRFFTITDGKIVLCVKRFLLYELLTVSDRLVDKCYTQAQQTRKLHSYNDLLVTVILICKNLIINLPSQSRKSILYRIKRSWRDDFEDYRKQP
jgi:hypothetical protein